MSNRLTPRLSGLVILVFMLTFACLLPTLALALSPGACPNETVRMESNVNPATVNPATGELEPYDLGLPECRAYEMVSPLEKQAHAALLQNSSVAPSGEAVTYVSKGDFGEPNNGFGASNSYVAYRDDSGWVTKSTDHPASVVQESSGEAFSPDLTAAALCGTSPAVTIRIITSTALCVVENYAETVETSSEVYPVLDGLMGGWGVRGASANLSTIVFQQSLPTGDDVPLVVNDADGEGIYALEGIGTSKEKLSLVNVNNAGVELRDPTASGAHEATVGSGLGDAYQAVSESGEIIYFSATPMGGVRTLYARIGGRETVAISNPSPSECTTCSTTPQEGIFQGASANGEKVFFLTSQQLVNADTDTTADLYMYNFETTPHIVQISGGGLGDLTPGYGANVQGVVRVSSNGEHVYFVATGVLTSLPNGLGQVAQLGADNMYVYDTESGATKFVADLCSGSGESGSVVDPSCPSAASSTDAGLWATNGTGQSQATPSGDYLAFDTYARLITSGPEADTDNALDVYRYDAQTGGIVRVSIGEPGEPKSDNGNTESKNATISSPGISARVSTNDEKREISENGEYVLFMTPEKLQADDVSAEGASTTTCGGGPSNPGCQVFLWHKGAISMISDGEDTRDEGESPVMSSNASNIFFSTATKLVGQDTDELGDVYDARIDGGFPAPTPEPSCSSEEACQGEITPQSNSLTPGGSLTQASGENLTPAAQALSEEEPKSKSAKLKITKAAGTSTGVTLTLSVPAAGKVTLTGADLKGATLKSTKAGAYRLKLKLTAAGRRALRKRHRLHVTVRATFKPTKGSKSSAAVTVTL